VGGFTSRGEGWWQALVAGARACQKEFLRLQSIKAEPLEDRRQTASTPTTRGQQKPITSLRIYITLTRIYDSGTSVFAAARPHHDSEDLS